MRITQKGPSPARTPTRFQPRDFSGAGGYLARNLQTIVL